MIDPNSWHAILYRWARTNWLYLNNKNFRRGYLTKRERETLIGQTNSCFYIRTWFQLPILLGLRTILLLGPLAAVIGPPIYLYGIDGLFGSLKFIGIIVAALAAFAGLLWVILEGVPRLSPKIVGLFKSGVSALNCGDPEKKSFCAMIWKCLKDWHDRICTPFVVPGRS